MSIRFKHQDLPSFVKGTVRPPVLPEVSQTLVTVPGKAGSLDFGNTIGNREIEFEYWIEYSDKIDLQKKIRQFSDWLYSEDAEPLELSRDPGKVYYAKVTGDVSLTESTTGGKGNITFLCADPYVYGAEKIVPLTADIPINITNNGSVDASPTLDFTFSGNSTDFTITVNDEVFYLGQPSPVDTTPPEPQQTLLVADQMDTTNGWGAGVLVDGGSIQGTFVSSSGQFKVSSFGTDTKWHGPALTKGLGKEVQDFTCQMFLMLKSSDVKQITRVECYLLNNNLVVGKIALSDLQNSIDSPVFEGRAGALAGGTKIAYSDVSKGAYSQFYGRLTLQRIKQNWWCEIAKRDPIKNSYFGRYSKSFYDTNSSYQTPVTSIQVHIGQFSSNPTATNVGIESLYFYEENTLTDTQVPIIFMPGDKLLIDSNKGIVMKNDDPFFSAIDPYSVFPRLNPGSNQVTINPSVFSSGILKYREKWL